MANAKIDIVGLADIPLIVNLYSQIFRPPKDAEFFKRRFLGRYNPLLLVASLDDHPVGFFTGFELKPTMTRSGMSAGFTSPGTSRSYARDCRCMHSLRTIYGLLTAA